MTISSRFALASHLLSLISLPASSVGCASTLSSDQLAHSAGVNPVIVRGVSGMLRRAGLVQSRQGIAGLKLTRPAAEITLLDIYRAVQPPEQLIALHEHPNPNCVVGAHIGQALGQVCEEAQQALEARLALTTLADLNGQLLLAAQPQLPLSDPHSGRRRS